MATNERDGVWTVDADGRTRAKVDRIHMETWPGSDCFHASVQDAGGAAGVVTSTGLPSTEEAQRAAVELAIKMVKAHRARAQVEVQDADPKWKALIAMLRTPGPRYYLVGNDKQLGPFTPEDLPAEMSNLTRPKGGIYFLRWVDSLAWPAHGGAFRTPTHGEWAVVSMTVLVPQPVDFVKTWALPSDDD